MRLFFDTNYWNPEIDRPRLFLAPMEGLNDAAWRKAYSEHIAGFDEACTEFIRMPATGHAPSLARAYQWDEIAPLPLAAQIMGEDPQACAAIAREIQNRGAQRIDLNCGCPSNTVVGKGAGSSLLKNPDRLYEILIAIKSAVTVPLSVKMRAGYEDTSLFEQNLLAAQSAGCCFLTLHPRTKVQGYSGRAQWELIAHAKKILSIPVVASGDVTTAQSALDLYSSTGCDGIMIGRGAFIDPWIFWKIRCAFLKAPWVNCTQSRCEQLRRVLLDFLSHLEPISTRGKLGRLKQVCRFLMQYNEKLHEKLRPLLQQNLEVESMIEILSKSMELT